MTTTKHDKKGSFPKQEMREVIVAGCAMYSISVPQHWTPEQIESSCNDARHFLDMVKHLLGELNEIIDNESCPTSYIKWRYIQEITGENKRKKQ